MLRSLETAFLQVAVVTAVGAAGLVLVVGEWGFGLWLAVAAMGVQAGLACRLAALRAARRELCLRIIAAGSSLPLLCVERTRRQLLGKRAHLLAKSIDELVAIAARPPALPASRPFADVRVIRAVAPELSRVAVLLRADPSVSGVAFAEWLLSSPATPLYGRDARALLQELRRACYLLELQA